MEWSDLRIFLAVAELGSLRQAADRLGVTQPTVARRIRNLEMDLGLPLFERTREGHRLTPAGAALLPDVRLVETAALRVEQKSLGLTDQLSETVRVEAGETAAAILAAGLSLMPDGPNIELLVTGLHTAEADRPPEILVRHDMPSSGHALTKRVGSVESAVYGAPNFAEERVLPLTSADLAALPWLGFVEEQEMYITMRWLRGCMRGRAPAARMMNTDLMIAAARSGVGITVLPCFRGDYVPELVRLTGPIEELQADYWTVTDPDLSRNSAVRATINWIANCFQSLNSDFEKG